MEILDLLSDIAREVAYEKTSVMGYIGIFNFANTIVIKIFNHIMAKKVASSYNSKSNVRLTKSIIYMSA